MARTLDGETHATGMTLYDIAWDGHNWELIEYKGTVRRMRLLYYRVDVDRWLIATKDAFDLYASRERATEIRDVLRRYEASESNTKPRGIRAGRRLTKPINKLCQERHTTP